jgi:hypothetical protein
MGGPLRTEFFNLEYLRQIEGFVDLPRITENNCVVYRCEEQKTG